METSVLFSGFGGQGILFMGKFFAYYGMLNGYEVSWIPSYGAEMRGGTANCAVRVSKETIGSPVVAHPDLLVCMNKPSLDKYEKNLLAGGALFIDNSVFNEQSGRDDVSVYYAAAARTADLNGMPALANMVMMGKILTVKNIYDDSTVRQAMEKTVPARRKEMFDMNIRAIEMGRGL